MTIDMGTVNGCNYLETKLRYSVEVPAVAVIPWEAGVCMNEACISVSVVSMSGVALMNLDERFSDTKHSLILLCLLVSLDL